MLLLKKVKLSLNLKVKEKDKSNYLGLPFDTDL